MAALNKHELYKNFLRQFADFYIHDYILSQLVILDVITNDERDSIEHKKLNADKLIQLFLYILPYKNERCHRDLIVTFEKYHYDDSANFLRAHLVTFGTQAGQNIEHAATQGGDRDQDDLFSTANINDFVDRKFLHRGFGKVFTATFRLTSRGFSIEVAVKIIPTNEENQKVIQKEIEMLRTAVHPNVVKILTEVDNIVNGETWIVMEYMNTGSLRPYCTGWKNTELCNDEKRSISLQCWEALSYLHNVANITHRDIKPDNILLHRPTTPNAKITAKICDFGLSEVKQSHSHSTSICGTPMYFPPEFSGNLLSPYKSDVYSMGASLCELYSGVYFWCHEENGDCLTYVQIMYKLGKIEECVKDARVNGTTVDLPLPYAVTRLPADCPNGLRELMKRTVDYDRTKRPLAEEVLDMLQ